MCSLCWVTPMMACRWRCHKSVWQFKLRTSLGQVFHQSRAALTDFSVWFPPARKRQPQLDPTVPEKHNNGNGCVPITLYSLIFTWHEECLQDLTRSWIIRFFTQVMNLTGIISFQATLYFFHTPFQRVIYFLLNYIYDSFSYMYIFHDMPQRTVDWSITKIIFSCSSISNICSTSTNYNRIILLVH